MTVNVKELRGTVQFALFAAGVPSFVREDVEQQVWLEVVRASKRFDESRGASFRTFVRARALGAAIDARRLRDPLSRGHRELIRAGICEKIEIVPLDRARTCASYRKTPESAAIEAVLVRSALTVLGGRRRYIVEQSFLEERVDADIARELGLTAGRVSQLKTAALRKMRSRLCESPTAKSLFRLASSSARSAGTSTVRGINN